MAIAADEGWIEENPAHMMDRSRFKEKLVKIILPRPDSIARAFAERSRFMDMAELSLETGMRQEEVASLEHDRVDRKRMSISLEHTKSGVREVPLTARAVTIIDRQPQFLRSPYVSGAATVSVSRMSMPSSTPRSSGWHKRRHDPARRFAVSVSTICATCSRCSTSGIVAARSTIFRWCSGTARSRRRERYLDHLTPEEKHWATHGVSQNAAQDERFEEGKAG
ncbi:hypothetical protein [Sphingosinicella ginsenosidimutans]|uniref:hypothetical protein n=1 Tax=Allosphingosinicella ginsenosidimutans TaxID=1176539 RepID=UPI003C7113FC